MLSGRGLCDGLIARVEGSDCGVSLCVISKNLKIEETIDRDWAASDIKKIVLILV